MIDVFPVVGADQLSVIIPSPASAFTMVGFPGTLIGVDVTSTDCAPTPALVTAATRNVYNVPFVREETVIDGSDVVKSKFPGLTLTRYPVMACPPVAVGGAHVRYTRVFPWVADSCVGTPGSVTSVTGADAAEYVPTPTAFVAATAKV
jgi:hypothetical protein